MTIAVFALLAAFQAPVLEAPPQVQRFVAEASAWIDEKPDTDVETLRASFSDEMKAVLSAQAVEKVLASTRDSGDVHAALIDVRATGEIRSYTYLLEQEHSRWLTIVALDAKDRVAGWWIKVAPRWRPRTELVAATEALEGDVSFALEVRDAKGAIVDSAGVSRGPAAQPLGSIFKLYVLAELARAVDAGEHSLDDELVIEERWKSLPSGTLQDRDAGSKVKVRDAASEMIRISDNTAADLLLHWLGRDKVEAGLAHCHLADPRGLTPFLSTLELFAAKGLSREQYERVFGRRKLDEIAIAWRDAELEQRRAWLAELDRLLDEGDPAAARKSFGLRYGFATLGSKEHTAIEWHASARDVVALIEAAQRGELWSAGASKVFLDFYAKGAPLYPLPGPVAQGFKGGSETGVFALSTRVVFANGRSVVACVLRSRFAPADAKVPDETIALFLDWLQNAVEARPEAAAK